MLYFNKKYIMSGRKNNTEIDRELTKVYQEDSWWNHYEPSTYVDTGIETHIEEVEKSITGEDFKADKEWDNIPF